MECLRTSQGDGGLAACAGRPFDRELLIDLKVVRLIDTLKHGRQRGPVMLELNLTNACNLSCGFCWKQGIQDDNAFGTRRAKRLVREAAKLGAKWVRITGGGEPFLDSGAALAVMREAKRHGMYGTLVTNATTFDRRSVREIVAMRWDEVLVSLDGATARTHDSLRGRRGAFDKAVSTLRMLADEKESRSCATPAVKLQCVVTRQNYGELLGYVDLAKKSGAEAVDLLPLMDLSPHSSNYRLDAAQRAELKEIVEDARMHAQNASLQLRADSRLYASGEGCHPFTQEQGPRPLPSVPDARKGALLCYEPFLSITVQANGSVAPCCCWFDSDFLTVGEGGLAGAWYSETFKELRERFEAGRLHDNCKGCHAYRQETAGDLARRLDILWDDSQHRQRYVERVEAHDSLPGLYSGGVATMGLSGRLMGLAARSAELMLLGLDSAGMMLKRVTRSVESALLTFEDKLREHVAHYQLPPFVLGKDEALALMEPNGRQAVVARFEENVYPDCYLAGTFPDGAVTTEQVRIVHPPTPGRGCRRVRFRLPPGDAHGEVFVKVRAGHRDWRAQRMLNLWYRGRSEGARLGLTLTDAEGQRWFSHHKDVLIGGHWHLLRVPFENFHCPEEFRRDNVLHLEDVTQMSVHLSCNPYEKECRGWVDLYEAFTSE